MPVLKPAGLCSTPSIGVPSTLFQVTTSCEGCGHDATWAPMSVSFFIAPVLTETVQISGNSAGPDRTNAIAPASGVRLAPATIPAESGVTFDTVPDTGSRRYRCDDVRSLAPKRMPPASHARGDGSSSNDEVRFRIGPPDAGITAMRVFA